MLCLLAVPFLTGGCSGERTNSSDRSDTHPLTRSQRPGSVADGRFVGLRTYDPTSYAASVHGIKASSLGSNAYAYEQRGHTTEDALRRAQQNWGTRFDGREPTDPEPDEHGAAGDTPCLLLVADGRMACANPRRATRRRRKQPARARSSARCWALMGAPSAGPSRRYLTIAEWQAMSREQHDRWLTSNDGLGRCNGAAAKGRYVRYVGSGRGISSRRACRAA